MNARGLLFDFGGTLDSDGVHWCEVYWDLYRAQGVPVDRAHFERAFVEGDRGLALEPPGANDGFRFIIEQQVRFQLEYLEATVADFRRRPDDAAALVKLAYDGVVATTRRAAVVLETVGRGRTMGVVSNFYGNLDRVLEEFNLRRYFAATVDSVLVGVSKPDPEIFRIGADRLGLPASECAVIGDSYDRDVVPGKRAGCATIWLRGRSWREFNETAQADVIVGSLQELPAILK